MRQQKLAVMGETRKTSLADRELIERCPTAHQAALLQIQLSGLTDESVCDSLGIDKGHFSRMRTGTAHFPTRKLGALQDLCGNAALAQWLARAAGYELKPMNAMRERIEALEAELANLKGAV